MLGLLDAGDRTIEKLLVEVWKAAKPQAKQTAPGH
jgi:hypothetical protein